MSATLAMVSRLRRMVAEPTTETYENDDLTEYIERYPLFDSEGRTSDDSGWAPTYDLNAAAADIWDEKAAAVSADFAFSADGSRFDRNQVYEQYRSRAEYYRRRRAAKTMTLVSWPKEDNVDTMPWIGNLPEAD